MWTLGVLREGQSYFSPSTEDKSTGWRVGDPAEGSPKGFEEQTVQQKLTYTNTFYRIVNETITGEFCEVCTGRKCQAHESKWFSSIQWAMQSLSTAINLGSLTKQAVLGGTQSHVIFSNMEVQRWLGSTCFLTLRLPYGRSIKCQCSKSS